MSLLIDANGLSKVYPKVHRRADRIRAMWQLLTRDTLSPSLSATVLQDVSLQVYKGQSLGIIGENGAGKSTLLKLLTGVLHPSRGNLRVQGQIGALLELGAGFHPEYTGLENLELVGALYGFSRAELKAKMPEIIAFADIGHYLNEPVKHYSSGMVVRLGFALLAVRRPDLLITDEVLAVGEESFQKKCVRWIEDYLSQGGTLLLVSHSTFHIQKLCKHALWLRQGRVEAYGDVYDVTQRYLAYHEQKSAKESEQTPLAERNSAHYQMRSVRLNDAEPQSLQLRQGSDLSIEMQLYSPCDRAPVALIGFVRADGTPVYGVTSDFDHFSPVRTGPNLFALQIRFPALALLPGGYVVRLHVLDPEGVRLFDSSYHDLTVSGESREFGLVRLAHAWTSP